MNSSTARALLYRRSPAGEPGELTVAWFGTTCELISDGETALLVDPYLTRTAGLLALATNRRVLAPDPAQYDRWLAPLHPPIRAMPVTHTHFDHILDAGVVGARTGAMLAGSASTAAVGRSLGLPAEQLAVAEPGLPLRFGRFTVTFLPGRHSGRGAPAGEITGPVRVPARLAELRQGGTFSVLVEHPAGTLLCHHSAGCVPGALAGHSAGVAFLSAASPPSDLDAYLRETVDAVGAHTVFLVHWDDFTRPLHRPLKPLPLVVKMRALTAALRRRGLRVHTLPVGAPQLLYPAPDQPG